MAFDLLTKVSRLVNGQRYTSTDLGSTQEAYQSSLQLGIGEIWAQDLLIPSSSLPFYTSSAVGTLQSSSILNYWYKFPLTLDNSATATGSSVWFFTSPSGSVTGIGGQLIDSGQQTNFISPKYGIPGISGNNTEANPAGYAITINSSSNNTTFGFVNPNTYPYQFDYKTGVLEFTSTAIPTGNLYATVYQYNGQFLSSALTNITASSVTVTGVISASAFSGSHYGTSSYAVSSSFSSTSSYALNSGATLSGSNNYVPVWTNNALSLTSSIYQSGIGIGIGTTTLSASYMLQVSGTIAPVGDGKSPLGNPNNRFSDVFALQTTVGAFFELGLQTTGIGENPTGTVVSWKNGRLIPSEIDEDELVMGVVQEGKDEPIILGAETILVTGIVNEGDFIVTSSKKGHGKAIKRGLIFKRDLFGKVIAQALESSNEDSKLIKAMIRKM